MAERKLNVVVSANLTALRAELARGEAIIGTTSAAMKRMGDSYSGASTIANANAAMLQIEKLGGVTSLTEKEQRKLHSTLSEGVAKYQAMGQTAPASMLAMRDATAKLGDTTTSLTGSVKNLAGSLGIAFGSAAIIGGIKSLISNTLEYADTIKNTAAKMDASMEATQRWKFAAEQTGASLEDVSKSVLKLSQGIDGDDKSLAKALLAAGVQMDDLKGKKPEEAFNIVAEAIAKIPDPMTQARVALEAFGKSGTELLPAIRQGFTDVADSAAVMSDQTVLSLSAAKDAWDKFSNQVTVATGNVVGKIVGMMERIAPAMQLMFAVTGQRDAAEMWSAFVKGANDAETATNSLTAAQKKYVDELIKSKRYTTDEISALSPAIAAYVESLNRIPSAAGPAARSVGAMNKELKNTLMVLPGVKESDGVRAFFDSLRVGSDSVLMTLPGVKAGFSDFLDSIRVGNDELAGAMMGLPGIAEKGVQGFLDGIEVRNDDIRSIGSKIGDSLKSGLSEGMKGVGGVIVGAIQGGGDVARAAGAHLGLSIGNDLAKSLGPALQSALGKTLGSAVGSFLGPLGALFGDKIGGWIGGIFGGNDTKKDREQAAKVMGFSSLDGLYTALRGMGEEGNALVHAGLNTIGKKDSAANQEWIRSVQALFEKQKTAAVEAAVAVETASGKEIAAINKVTEAIQGKIDALDSERDSVFNSIREELENPEYDEAGNRIYGVIEAQGIARLEEIEKQKYALTVQMAEASAKVMDTATVTAEGIKKMMTEMFADPFKIKFDVPSIPGLPSGWTGGGSSSGWPGRGSAFPSTTAASVSVVINNPQVRSGNDIPALASAIVDHWEQVGARG
jgi:hypothetical protein